MASIGNVPPIQAGVETLTDADAQALNNRIRDGLANKLGGDWKNFARGTEYLKEPDIEGIDIDKQTVHEKCLEMIKKWERVSTSTVTIAMVKLILIRLGRNDILLDIFHSSPGTEIIGPERTAFASASRGSNPYAFFEPTVMDLEYKHTQKLCNFLDPDHGVGIKNWLQLGNAIFQGDKDVSDRIESLHLSYSGGGSPAGDFLKNLGMRHPSLTVQKFIDVAKKHERKDVSSYLEGLNCPNGQHLRDVSFVHHEKVARDLDKNIRGVADWRSFADTFGYSNDEIQQFRLAVKEKHQYSPTQSLLDLIKGRYPKLTLTKFKMAASSIGRNDVAHYLGSIIEELAARNN